MVRAWVMCICSAPFCVLGLPHAWGQNYPNKPVRIVAAAAGGGTDFAARQMAPALTANLGQQIIIENRGGSVTIPAELVAKSPADGYTLLLYGSALWLMPFLRDDVRYDPLRDFSPITLTGTQCTILVVHPSLPVKSVKELIALAKAHPGALNYSSAQPATPSHMAAELFKSMAGVNIVHIGYQGTAPALIDVVSGQVQLMFSIPSAGMPLVKSGKLRALAVTSAQRSALAPELPTVAASGVPGYEAGVTNAIFAPAKTPAAIISRLNQEFGRVLNQPAMKEKLLSAGIEVVTGTPEQLTAAVKAEMTVLGKVIKDAGIRDQ